MKALLPLLLLGTASASAGDIRYHPGRWRVEAQVPSRVEVRGGAIEIEGHEGITLWLERVLSAPVRIRFRVMAVAEGGPDDAVSDVNAFWMAQEADGAAPRVRSGRFEDYDTMRTYYVGIGGNRNTSTRMRRYVGRAGDRPLLPEHDRGDTAVLLRPNRWMQVALIADGRRAAVVRDGCVLFVLDDAHAYRRGWFGLRTTRSHLRVRDVAVDRHTDLSRTPRCPAPPPASDRRGAPAATPAA